MTVVVPIAAGAAPGPRARPGRLARKRTLMIGTTLLVIGAVAAIPLPVWRSSHEIADRAATLRGWIDDVRRQQAEVAAYRAGDSESRAARAAADVERWLALHDRLGTRNLILKTARACGLAVTGANVTPDIDPLAAEAPTQRGTTVLGAALDAPPLPPASVAGTPLPLQADRYVVTGTGSAPSLLLFCGVLHAMPAPLRLRSVRVETAGDNDRFTITIDKLRDSRVQLLPEAEPESEGHASQDA